MPIAALRRLRGHGGPERLQRTPQWLWFSVALLVFEIAYFAVSEGRWGASPGKALVGLRVGGLDRNAPGIPRALLRALIYLVPTIVSLLRFFDAWSARSRLPGITPWRHRLLASILHCSP